MIKWCDLTSAQKNMLVHERVMDLPASDAAIPAYTESMDAAWKVLQRLEESCIMVLSEGHQAFASDLFLAEISKGEYLFQMHGEMVAYMSLKDIVSLTPMKICETALRVLCNDIDFGESEERQ